MNPQRQDSSTRPIRNKERSWLLGLVCGLALLAVLFVAVEAGVPLPLVAFGLVLACVGACGWAVLAGVLTRRKVEDALRAVIDKGDLVQ